jgi:hypothetical protein
MENNVGFGGAPATTALSGASVSKVTSDKGGIGTASAKSVKSWASHGGGSVGMRRSVRAEVGNHPVAERAFVVNVDRVASVNEWLLLLNEFVKSTAIAALTLVAAGSGIQLRNTVIFLVMVMLVFQDHNAKYDRLDIDDFIATIPLNPDMPRDNPNQVLRSMGVRSGKFGEIWNVASYIFEFLTLAMVWIVFVHHQAHEFQDLEEDKIGFVALAHAVAPTEDDLSAVAMQTLVFTLMWCLHLTFTLIHIYETKAVMPMTSSGKVWDVRKDGVPCKFALLGLPSMWFSCAEAYDDLVSWVDALKSGTAFEIFPEELGMLALKGSEEERGALALNLLEAKKYDVGKMAIAEDRPLDITLAYFTSETRVPDMDHPGEFTYLTPMLESEE